MKKTRLISMLCAIAMSLTLVLPVSAYENTTECDVLIDYDQITVFTAYTQDTIYQGVPKNSIANRSSNIKQARKAVLALNLSEQGYSYIESACLAELDELALDTSCILNEYTVLIPKTRATTPSYYATYNGVDFYTSITSKSNITIEKLKFGTYEKLAKWASLGINLTLSYSGAAVASYAWSLITSDLPIANYKVHTKDWVDCYININPTNRAIYTKDGTAYKNVANREYGLVRPYSVYHYNDATTATGTSETTFPSRTYPDVTTATRDDLLYVAYQIHSNNALPVNLLLKNIVGFRWN